MGNTRQTGPNQESTPGKENYSPPPMQASHDFTLQTIMQLQQSHGELKQGIISLEVSITRLISAQEKSISNLQSSLEKAHDKHAGDIEKSLNRLEDSQKGICDEVKTHGKQIYAAIVVGGFIAVLLTCFGFWAYDHFVNDVASKAADVFEQRFKKP